MAADDLDLQWKLMHVFVYGDHILYITQNQRFPYAALPWKPYMMQKGEYI